MKLYKKPVIMLDAGMAEGIYAADSGSSSTYTLAVADQGVAANYGSSGGQRNYLLDLTNVNNKNVTLYLKFNTDITGGWGSNSSPSANGQILTLSWYQAPASATITVQTNTDITALDLVEFGFITVYDN